MQERLSHSEALTNDPVGPGPLPHRCQGAPKQPTVDDMLGWGASFVLLDMACSCVESLETLLLHTDTKCPRVSLRETSDFQHFTKSHSVGYLCILPCVLMTTVIQIRQELQIISLISQSADNFLLWNVENADHNFPEQSRSERLQVACFVRPTIKTCS